MQIGAQVPTTRTQSARPAASPPPAASPTDRVELSGAQATAYDPRLAEIDRRLAAGGLTGRARILLSGERNRLMAESNRRQNPEFEPGPALGFCESSERSLRVVESATGRVGPVQNLHGILEAGCTPNLTPGQRIGQAATEAAASRGRGMAIGAGVGGQVGMTGGAIGWVAAGQIAGQGTRTLAEQVTPGR